MKKAFSMAAFALALLVSANSFASSTYSTDKDKTTKKVKSGKEEKSCTKAKSSCCSKSAKTV